MTTGGALNSLNRLNMYSPFSLHERVFRKRRGKVIQDCSIVQETVGGSPQTSTARRQAHTARNAGAPRQIRRTGR